MEFFRDVHSVRLLGHKGKFLWADDDRHSVAQKKGQDSYGVIWRVELVPERHTIRLKSVYDLYLMASDYPFLLGATGKKVMQSFDSRSENVEWEPISAGSFVKFRTKGDKFLRANGGMPPYRNSVTHDVPVLASNQHVVLWEVEVVRKKQPAATPAAAPSPKQVHAFVMLFFNVFVSLCASSGSVAAGSAAVELRKIALHFPSVMHSVFCVCVRFNSSSIFSCS